MRYPSSSRLPLQSATRSIQARTLSMLAHLQAKAGDFAGAFGTAKSIPTIKREDFPGPSDGFYDAIKPSTLAIIADLQYQSGEKAAGAETTSSHHVVSSDRSRGSEDHFPDCGHSKIDRLR